MASISAQEIDDEHIRVVSSQGREAVVTREQILDHYNSSTAPDRQAETTTWIKNVVSTALGSDFLDISEIVVSFDTASGSPTVLTLGGG